MHSHQRLPENKKEKKPKNHVRARVVAVLIPMLQWVREKTGAKKNPSPTTKTPVAEKPKLNNPLSYFYTDQKGIKWEVSRAKSSIANSSSKPTVLPAAKSSPPPQPPLIMHRDINMRTREGKAREGLHDPISIISSFLTGDAKKEESTPNDFAALASYVCTAKPDNLARLFLPPLEKEKKYQINKLLQHVVKGEVEEVKWMLEQPGNLSFLLCSARVKTYSYGNFEAKTEEEKDYQEVEGTAYRLALAAKDVSIRGEQGMAELIRSYLKKLPDGDAEIKKQENEQFPIDWRTKQRRRQEADSAALHNVFKALAKYKNENDAPRLKSALEQFRKRVTESHRLITSGYQFNDQLLIEALQLYWKHYKAFGDYHGDKNHFAWQKIIGYIERFIPANYAQAICTPLSDIYNNHEMPKRSFSFRPAYITDALYPPKVFYPLDNGRLFRLGDNCGAWRTLHPIGEFETNDFSSFSKEKTANTRAVMHEKPIQADHHKPVHNLPMLRAR